MKIIFSKRRHVGSWLIRTVTWSEWSHVELVLPNGQLLGAAAPHGVVVDKLDKRLSIASQVIEMDVSRWVNASAVEAWANEQVGKPYDWAGCVGIGIHRDLQDDKKWFCSEFVVAALCAGGFEPYRLETLHRITPQDLWKLNLPTVVLKG